jgi:putative transposase
MPRHSRCVRVEIAHHVTQRGSNQQDVFYSQQDRDVYLDLVRRHKTEAGVRVLAWCLMTNHVHWVVVPERPESLAVLFRRVHGRYAQYLNARRDRSGHLWQNRYFSCALQPRHEWTALRYVEWNPLRAGLVECPEAYRWSSAAAHFHGPDSEAKPLLDWTYWQELGGVEGWRRLLGEVEDVRDVHRLRRATSAGAPLGSDAFVEDMEREFRRNWRHEGRPRKSRVESETGRELSAPCCLVEN